MKRNQDCNSGNLVVPMNSTITLKASRVLMPQQINKGQNDNNQQQQSQAPPPMIRVTNLGGDQKDSQDEIRLESPLFKTHQNNEILLSEASSSNIKITQHNHPSSQKNSRKTSQVININDYWGNKSGQHNSIQPSLRGSTLVQQSSNNEPQQMPVIESSSNRFKERSQVKILHSIDKDYHSALTSPLQLHQPGHAAILEHQSRTPITSTSGSKHVFNTANAGVTRNKQQQMLPSMVKENEMMSPYTITAFPANSLNNANLQNLQSSGIQPTSNQTRLIKAMAHKSSSQQESQTPQQQQTLSQTIGHHQQLILSEQSSNQLPPMSIKLPSMTTTPIAQLPADEMEEYADNHHRPQPQGGSTKRQRQREEQREAAGEGGAKTSSATTTTNRNRHQGQQQRKTSKHRNQKSSRSGESSDAGSQKQQHKQRGNHRSQQNKRQPIREYKNKRQQQQSFVVIDPSTNTSQQEETIDQQQQQQHRLKRANRQMQQNNNQTTESQQHSAKLQGGEISSQSQTTRSRKNRQQRQSGRNTTSLTVVNGNNSSNIDIVAGLPLTPLNNGSEEPNQVVVIEKESKRRKFILKRKQILAKQKAQAQQQNNSNNDSPKTGQHRSERRHRRSQTHEEQQQREQQQQSSRINKKDAQNLQEDNQKEEKLSDIDEKRAESPHLDQSPFQIKTKAMIDTNIVYPNEMMDQDNQLALQKQMTSSETAKMRGGAQQPGTQQQLHNETSRQQQKDMKILQKCFNRSLERMQQNYEGSIFLQHKSGEQQVPTMAEARMVTSTRSNQFWTSPRVTLNKDAAGALLSGFTIDHVSGNGQLAGFEGCPNNELDSPRKRREGDWAFPPTIMPLASNMQNGLAINSKPRTSVGLSRDQVNLSGGKILDGVLRPGEDFGKQIKILRDSLNTSHKTQRQTGYQQIIQQSPMKTDAMHSFSSAIHAPNQIMRTGTINGSAMNAQYFSPTHQMQQLAQHGEAPTSGTLRNSIQSPAKQHQFRKQLKLQTDPQQEQHHLVLIESSGGPSDERYNEQARKGEITLKAVKMSRIVNQSAGQSGGGSGNGSGEQHLVYQQQISGEHPPTTLMLETIEPMKDSGLSIPVTTTNGSGQNNDSQMKLKIITTQIPQSLLMPNSNASSNINRTLEAVERYRGQSVEGGSEPMQLTFATRNNQHVIFSQQQSYLNRKGVHIKGGLTGNQGFVNGFLVPTNQFKTNHTARNSSHNTSSMPPSLTAINVQQTQLMAREAVQNSQFHSGAYNPAAKQVIPGSQNTSQQQRRIVKKKTSQSQVNQNQQMKLARRQIQFYQKRLAEKHLPARTPKSAFVTQRLLFKRRQRLQDQNLLIFYFDGVIGELCNKNSSYGYFKVRHGVWQSLRKLSYKYQIAVLIPYVKARAKVIACYFDKFQGCPIDAIYCVRSSYMKEHSDLRFVDYRQIYEDFDMGLDEKLIDKCMVIAPRTKEVSSYHLQNAPSETIQQQSRLWIPENNQPEENLEEQKLMQMYLVNQELQMSSRIDIFQFQGCPANLSPQLEPTKRKVNYLHTNEEVMSPTSMSKNSKDAQQQKEKQTATQANKIAVDLGQLQKPVTLFVPHTRNISTVTNSFQPICKVIEDLAILDEHCKARRDQIPLLRVGDSFDSSSQGITIVNGNNVQTNVGPGGRGDTPPRVQVIGQQHNCPPLNQGKQTGISGGKNGGGGAASKQEMQPFSLIDAFYAFKTVLVGTTSCCVYSSLLKTLFAVETKKVQTFLYKDSMVGRVLLEKAEIKKCYQYTQYKHAQVDRTAPTASSHYVQMKTQNEYLKRYITEYSNVYYSKVKETMDEAKIMRMTAYFMNQFSQRLVEDKNKKPNQHLREMFHKEISYDEDLPSRNINLFKNHRFLIMVKSTGLGAEGEAEDLSTSTTKGPSMETVDMQKIMGNSYFRQLEQFRQGVTASQKPGPPEILPPNIVRILFRQRHSDMTEWFTKKAFSKPIQLLEKQQMIQERKELILRGEQEKANQISGFQPPATTNDRGAQSLPPFTKSHTVDNVGGAGQYNGMQDQHNFVPKRVKDGNNGRVASNSPNKHQRGHVMSRGKTVQLSEKA